MCRKNCCKCKSMMCCCGCCNDNEERVTDTVLYDGFIDKEGEYALTDDINHYDDVFVFHDYTDFSHQQCFHSPVACLNPNSNYINFGNLGIDACARFTITNTKLNVLAIYQYRIVKVVGRKY